MSRTVAGTAARAPMAPAGVQAPQALVLPDPSLRFARVAARLAALSAGHPMADWLRFMARLANVQHVAAMALPPPAIPPLAAIEAAVQARRPPLAPEEGPRGPAWRGTLALMLGSLDAGLLPTPARLAVESLQRRDADWIERLADDFLRGAVDAADAAETLYVGAALQVHFTRQAAALPAACLRLLPRRGLCPCCGSTPVSGMVTEAATPRGARYLHCSLCATAWNHVRAVCITCGESGKLSLLAIEGAAGVVKAEACGACGAYAKTIYQAADMAADPVADDLASLGLDMLVCEAGWSRHAANPLLLAVGQ